MLGTANFGEILWTFIAIVGIFVHLLDFREALGADDLLKKSGLNGPLKILSKQAIRHSLTMLAVQLSFFFVGVVALGTPAFQKGVLSQSLVQWALILAALLMVSNSITAHRERRVLVEKFSDDIPMLQDIQEEEEEEKERNE